MSTRSIIARPVGDGFEGRYHHSDGYPTWLGRVLWRRLHSGTTRDYLLNAHPAGWSHLADPDYPITRVPKAKWGSRAIRYDDANQDACYCHGGPYIGKRSEPEQLLRHDEDACQEWAYVISETFLTVLVVVGRPEEDGMGAYRVAWSGPLSGPEPDWELVQANGDQLYGLAHGKEVA